MKDVLISETFRSLEGEGPYSGQPTFYVRLVGCNKKCSKFNNPEDKDINYNKPGFDETLGFDPKDFDDLKDLPPITVGCDSIYSISDNRFKHLWKHQSWEQIMKDHREGDALSITGGEPTLWQKQISEFLWSELSHSVNTIIYETNCSVSYTDDFIAAINHWLIGPNNTWVWSNSPKLSKSGEKWLESVIPANAKKQLGLTRNYKQYFKFVVDGTQEMYDEVRKACVEYEEGGVSTKGKVWLMPMACNDEQQNAIATSIANYCVENGWNYSHRLQSTLWGNLTGT